VKSELARKQAEIDELLGDSENGKPSLQKKLEETRDTLQNVTGELITFKSEAKAEKAELQTKNKRLTAQLEELT
jgi:hypothetical protein